MIKDKKDWPLWEVFIRSKQGLNHKNVGSLRASDSTMAIENARDVYTKNGRDFDLGGSFKFNFRF